MSTTNERQVALTMSYGDMLWVVNAMTTEARRLAKNGHKASAANLLRIASGIHGCAGNTALAWVLSEEATEKWGASLEDARAIANKQVVREHAGERLEARAEYLSMRDA
jgi:hypothetical protein